MVAGKEFKEHKAVFSSEELARQTDVNQQRSSGSRDTLDTADHPRVSRVEAASVSKPQRLAEEGTDANVWVHIYHCDPYTGFLNRMLLTQKELGIYHAGIEVYGEEWSFQYYEDTWNDPSVSGVMRCLPKRMTDYEYRESVNLGPTTLSQDQVQHLLVDLQVQWPACSYHLTHNNCLTFAERFAEQLQTPETFPKWLKGILEASNQNASVDAVVDYSWSWVVWWMKRKHQPAEESKATCGSLFCFDGTCSGTICPGARTGISPGIEPSTRTQFAQGSDVYTGCVRDREEVDDVGIVDIPTKADQPLLS